MAPFDSFDFVVASPRVETPVTDDVLRFLIEGRRLISEPEHWMQGPFAVNYSRCIVDVWSPDAVGFCSAGALKAAATAKDYSSRAFNTARALLHRAAIESGQADNGTGNSHIRFNDDRRHTHADVMAMWDRAISARRAEIA